MAHVLFMDIVGYSRCLTSDQHALAGKLNQIVRSWEKVRRKMTWPAGEPFSSVPSSHFEPRFSGAESFSRTHQAGEKARLRSSPWPFGAESCGGVEKEIETAIVTR